MQSRRASQFRQISVPRPSSEDSQCAPFGLTKREKSGLWPPFPTQRVPARVVFRGMDLRGAKVRVFASHAFFAHKNEQLHQMKLLETARALFFVHPREVMGVEIPPPDLSFVHAPRRSAHATHNVPTCGVQRGRVGWPQRSCARRAATVRQRRVCRGRPRPFSHTLPPGGSGGRGAAANLVRC